MVYNIYGQSLGNAQHGGMAEWTKAAVLKTVMAKAIVGSNPTPTATLYGEVQEWLNWTAC